MIAPLVGRNGGFITALCAPAAAVMSGLAASLAVGQLPKLLGLPGEIKLLDGLLRPDLWRWPGIAVGLTTIAVTMLAPRVTKVVPAAILGLAAGIGAYFGIAALYPELMVVRANPLVIGPIEAPGR